MHCYACDMNIITDHEKIETALFRGVAEIIHKDALLEKMQSGEQLRIKLGIDPTSPNLHLGRSIPLLKLRDFQELGHQIVLIIGDFTGLVGDTSDKESERPMLTKETVQKNLETYAAQAGFILDMTKVEVRHNSEWLGDLSYEDILQHANEFSVNGFIARDLIKRRLDEGKRVSLREVLYPLMQGYDSVAVKADVEMGGTDQRFNLLAGRELQRAYGQEPQNIVMNELINGLDGRKMSSSWGNTVNLTDSSDDMYGKIMSLHDDLIITYFTLLTRVSMVDIKDYEKELSEKGNFKDIKHVLAREIVSMYHDEKEAQDAEDRWVQTFSHKQLPDEMPEITPEKDEALIDVLVRSGLVDSKKQVRRLIDEGALTNRDTDQKINDPQIKASPMVLQIGKKRFLKIM